MQVGIVNATVLCQNPHVIIHKNVWNLGNPLTSPTSLLFLQISIITIVTQLLDACLRPLGQTSLVSHILVSFFLTYTYFTKFNDHHNVNYYL